MPWALKPGLQKSNMQSELQRCVMKLEYLPTGPTNSGLVRLYEYAPGEVRALKEVARKLAAGACKQLSLQDEHWILSLDACRLSLQQGDGDFGIRRVGPLSFECELTVNGWRNVASLIAQFYNSKTNRFLWLVQQSRIPFLLSPDGQWRRILISTSTNLSS